MAVHSFPLFCIISNSLSLLLSSFRVCLLVVTCKWFLQVGYGTIKEREWMEEGGRGELGERATKTSLPLERPYKFSSIWVSSHHHYHHQFPCFWCIYSSIYSSGAWTPFHFFVLFGLDASCNIKINDFHLFIH